MKNMENLKLAGQQTDRNIFLIGFMGAGKSTVSQALKKLYGMEIIEMDQIIAEQNGMSISDIFKTKGEEYFRNEETELLRGCGQRTHTVISCGGGAAMREVNVQEMKKNGTVVLLTADPATILKRVENNHDRPLLENNKTVEYITELMEKRLPAYTKAADIMVATDGRPALEIAEEIMSRVLEA